MIRAAATVIWASGCLDYAQRCRPDPNEIETIPCDGVCINEIGAANADLITDTADRGNSDSTEATEDWVELYNNADHSIGLGYLELVRNDNGFAISRLPPITLEPGGCVLLVASAEPDRGPYTLAFDLNSDFGTLRLRTVDESCLVDRLWYPLQNELESYGRVPDGGTWTAMRDRTPCGDPEPEPAMTLPSLRTQPPRSESGPPDLGTLFDLHGEALCRTVHALSGSRQLAEDVVQDVFVFAHQRIHELSDGPGMKSWLFQVAIHRMRHDIRAGGRYRATLDRLGTEPDSDTPLPDEEVRRREQARRIEECVLAIPLVHREVFVLFELEGHSGQEVAEAVGIEIKTVWTRLHRGRLAFREAWGTRGSDE